MKHLSRISLVKGESLLSKEEMKRIVGKGTYRCCCGTGGSVPCFNVTAENENDASSVVDDLCYSLGYVKGDCFLS